MVIFSSQTNTSSHVLGKSDWEVDHGLFRHQNGVKFHSLLKYGKISISNMYLTENYDYDIFLAFVSLNMYFLSHLLARIGMGIGCCLSQALQLGNILMFPLPPFCT